ncbi:MAG TPA: right-handed parallel beta-helix repeat-containing protein [Myxococcota bacterium]|nr:right-handed parallel beta-helix repeat-containing protein [Myxococcota bacterium]
MIRHAAVGLVAVTLALSSLSAFAGAIDVTRFDDPDPAGKNTGLSLREAILIANGTPGPDTITLHAGTYRLTRRGDDATAVAGDLDVTTPITIEGDSTGATIIDAKKAKDRAFEVLDGGELTLRHVTVKGGSAELDGGAILNVGTLTVESSTFTGNRAGESGGAISSEGGSCSLTDVVVTKNKASFNDGGGLNFTVAGSAALDRVVVSSNSAGDTGGGVNSDDGVTVTMVDSLVSGNKSKREGGGLDPSAGSLTLTNTTVSGNHSAKGGGIQLETGGLLALNNVTIAGNKAREGAGLWTEAGTTATLTNTLIAKNSPFDCFGPVVSNGSNLIGKVDGCLVSGDTTGNIVGGPRPVKPVDPRLGPLRDNGGPSKTQALLPGSPAIDAVVGTCPPPAADQRGMPRSGTCDIGAFEVQ